VHPAAFSEHVQLSTGFNDRRWSMYEFGGSRFLLRTALCLLLLGICSSCAKHVKTLPSGPITISGNVNDATGLPLANDKMRLFRKRRYLETTTDASGHYTFPNLAAASYLLRPFLPQCSFIPSDADLDDLTSSVNEDFGGSGPGCGGEAKVNAGATSGPLTISGHVRDASGQPILGARVDLDDDTRAIRFTDFMGSYTFHVKPDDYNLRISGACTFTPNQVRKEDLKASVVQDFAAGSGCVTVTTTQTNINPTGSVFTVKQGATVLGTTYVRVEARSSPSDGLTRLKEIVAEQPATPSRSLTIAGDPAIERQTLVTLPGPDPDIAGATGPPNPPFAALTTAVAVGNSVVRFESQVSGTADPATINLFLQTARNFTPAAIPDLHGPAPATVPTARNTPSSSPTAPGISTSAVVAPGVYGELEVAASDTANVVVYGTQNGPFFSVDGGQTVKAATYNQAAAPPSAAFTSKGDPSVTVGAPDASFHQTIYFAQLEQAAPIPVNGNTPIVAISLYQSPDNGATFNNISFPINCGVAAAGCVVPDQEHLVGDRINRAVTPTGTADQLYLAWRNYTAQNSNAHTIAVACSLDGGLNWTTDLTTLASTGADFPRLSVGPDGSLLAAYAVYNPFPTTYSLNVQTWSSCASGLKPGKPVQAVKTVTEVTDMPGVDRTVLGNYSPSFDDSDGSAQTVFIVYSNEPSAGNDDVHVVESKDGGATWVRDSIVNTVGTGRRYFPWICSTVGKKFVTWYDRRNSTAAKPDLTAYYRSSVSDNGSSNSVGIGTESNVSGVDDTQCSPGFPSGVRGAIEITGCQNLPAGFIQGGTCQAVCAPGVTPPCGTGNACDFRVAAATRCPTPPGAPPETCQPGGGQPKYGDYNGAACALGTLFVAWASATPPKGAACVVAGLPAASASQCCSGNLVGGTCAPTAAACTPNGNACGGAAPACCSSGLNGLCQAGQCLPAIAMYTGSSCIGPGCAGLPVTITYHQTGACNGYVDGSGAHSTGPNAAYVFFGIERIDNSGGTTSFAFDPANLFVQQASQRFFDSTLSVYAGIFGPFAVVGNTLTPGQNLGFSVTAQGALVVSTTNPDGSTEANQTPFFLRYNRQPTDPAINLVKSDASRTSWPNTQDCKTITLN
jgi:hypothetical protein